MAKGDPAEARSQINEGRNTLQPQMQQYTNSLYPQQQQNWQNYNAAGQQQTQDYQNLMGSFGQMSQNSSPYTTSALGGFQGFANNGGYSPQDLQDIRARAVSSIRGQYQNAMDNVSRQKNIQGGYSPNYNAAMAKMTREQSYNTADALTNANAAIAQMVQSGKLAGLTGMGNLSTEDTRNKLAALQGGSSLYGTSPGLVKTFLDAVQGSNSDLAKALGLTGDFESNLLKIQAGLADAPGTGDLVLDRMGKGANIAGKFVGGVAGA